jgi:hypothetical protein
MTGKIEEQHQPRKRGEALFKAELDGITERNERARKVSRERRQVAERQAMTVRRAAEARRNAAIRAEHDAR